jgi:hypothetical protein
MPRWTRFLCHGDVEVDGSPVGKPTFSLKVRGGLRGRFRRPQPEGHAVTVV